MSIKTTMESHGSLLRRDLHARRGEINENNCVGALSQAKVHTLNMENKNNAWLTSH
jgi:hypothetical protein